MALTNCSTFVPVVQDEDVRAGAVDTSHTRVERSVGEEDGVRGSGLRAGAVWRRDGQCDHVGEMRSPGRSAHSPRESEFVDLKCNVQR